MLIQQFKERFSFIVILCLIFFGLFTSCKSNKKISNKNITSKNIPTSVKEFIESSEVFGKSFTGFALYDPASKKMLFEQD